jgi:hypothetical protein
MATLTAQSVSVTGTDVTMAAASAGGDKVAAGCVLHVRNGSGSSINVTILTPGNDKYGLARPDIVKAVGAGVQTAFRLDQYDLADPADSYLISITYSAVTTVTVGAVLI